MGHYPEEDLGRQLDLGLVDRPEVTQMVCLELEPMEVPELLQLMVLQRYH